MNLCPICGFDQLAEPPRSQFGEASYEICPSCGFEFGVTDDDEGFTYAGWRARWLAAGSTWSSSRPQPTGWDAAMQLARLGV